MADFKIGVITKAHGIRGELRVFPTTDDHARFKLLIGEKIKTEKDGETNFYQLENARTQKETVILKLKKINDRNAAETMTGAVILIPSEKALPLELDEYYIRDLIGLRAETESGEYLGILTDVLQTAANDVYVIEPENGESFLIPAIKNVIKNISREKIILFLPEGLRE